MRKAMMEKALKKALKEMTPIRPGEYIYNGDAEKLERYKVAGYDNSGDETMARLRLDLEVAWKNDPENIEDVEYEANPRDVALAVAVEDLVDMIRNGDSGSTDPLLHALDGEKRRGKKAVEVDITQLTWYETHQPKKTSTEYAVYILLYVRYECVSGCVANAIPSPVSHSILKV